MNENSSINSMRPCSLVSIFVSAGSVGGGIFDVKYAPPPSLSFRDVDVREKIQYNIF